MTTIGYSQPTAPGSSSLPVPKDDTTYVFLERRALEPTEARNAAAPDASKTGTGKAESEVVDTGIDVDGFELIDKKDTSATVVDVNRKTAPVQPSKVPPGPYSITAVRPSSQLVVLLQNILNPFVMGLTKQARAVSAKVHQALHNTELLTGRIHDRSTTYPCRATGNFISNLILALPSAPIAISFHPTHNAQPWDTIPVGDIPRGRVVGRYQRHFVGSHRQHIEGVPTGVPPRRSWGREKVSSVGERDSERC